MEVLERPDGELVIRYEGRRGTAHEPPTRMGPLWAGVTAWSPGPELRRVVSNVADHHISRNQQRHLATVEAIAANGSTTTAKKHRLSRATATLGAYSYTHPESSLEGGPSG